MADKSTQLILEALGKAALQPNGMPLMAHRNEAGLFPRTSTAQTLAQRCKDDGLLRVIRNEARGSTTLEICTLTDEGLAYLLEKLSPKQVLEDFLRILETRHTQVAELLIKAGEMQQNLEAMRLAVQKILPRIQPAASSPPTVMLVPPENLNGKATTNGVHESPLPTLDDQILNHLREWHRTATASEDCPLPELYRRLKAVRTPSIGEFHDCLRKLDEGHLVYLHPWTGPLYKMPEPAFALLIGHEVAWYASLRKIATS